MEHSAEFDANRQWFEKNKHDLLKKYTGQFVAVRGSQVVDFDSNGSALARRVYAKYGEVQFYITKVTEKEEILDMLTPFTEEDLR